MYFYCGIIHVYVLIFFLFWDKLGSWTYDYDSIDIQFLGKHEINRELFLSSNEWDVLSTKGNRNAKKYECCKEIFPDMYGSIHIFLILLIELFDFYINFNFP